MTSGILQARARCDMESVSNPGLRENDHGHAASASRRVRQYSLGHGLGDKPPQCHAVAAALRGDVGFRPFPHFYQLLHAFADEDTLRRANAELDALGYRTHEFGDSALIERNAWRAALGIRGRKKGAGLQHLLRGSSTRRLAPG